MREGKEEETKSFCQELGRIRKSHSCISQLKLLNLLGEKSQGQIKDDRVGGWLVYTHREGGLHSQLSKGQCSRCHPAPPSQLGWGFRF